jgi:hypothetical protein
LATALALGSLETAKAVVITEMRGIDYGLGRALLTNMSWWLLWVPLAGVVFWLARRFPLHEGRVRWALAHGAGCATLSLVHIGASAIFVRAGAAPPPGVINTVAGQFRSLLAGYLVTDIVTYGVILASYSALLSTWRLRDAEVHRSRLEIAAVQAKADRDRLESLMTRARLRALRSELNPHFLFNSLHSVAALVRRGDREGAIRTTSRIGDLLRFTLEGRDDPEVTLGEEIDLLRLYLDIEAVRFADRLDARIEVPSDLRPALVPSLMLQPLVENAIRHGVAHTRDAVSIEVRATRCDPLLYISVTDNGPGPVASALRAGGEGIGLGNLRERMSALYGDVAALDLRERVGGGAEVTARLPLRLPDAMEIDP